MRRLTTFLIVVVLTVAAGTASAQKDVGGGFEFGAKQQHRFEITPFAGYVWSASVNGSINDGTTIRSGEFDLKSSGFYGVAVDINAKPGFQLELLWQRADTELEFKGVSGVKQSLGDVAVEYWQIGGVTGVQRENIMPFTSFSLGGVRLAPKDGDDVWKFGVILGLGAKIYLSEKIGIRLQGRLPWIITDFGAGLGIGTGGVSAGIVGGGIIQADLSAGLIILL